MLIQNVVGDRNSSSLSRAQEHRLMNLFFLPSEVFSVYTTISCFSFNLDTLLARHFSTSVIHFCGSTIQCHQIPHPCAKLSAFRSDRTVTFLYGTSRWVAVQDWFSTHVNFSYYLPRKYRFHHSRNIQVKVWSTSIDSAIEIKPVYAEQMCPLSNIHSMIWSIP